MFITEIFRSIQGEGTRAGLPCVFVRLTGCNLRCTWCDTAYAFHGGKQMSLDEVLNTVDALAGRHPRPPAAGSLPEQSPAPHTSQPGSSLPATSLPRTSLVELTGGEPLLQPETVPLAERLLSAGYTVLIETSGERSVAVLPTAVVKIIDVKCPDSGEGGTFRMDNLAALDHKDEVKFVIASRRDYEFARDFMIQNGLAARVRQVLFSPVFA